MKAGKLAIRPKSSEHLDSCSIKNLPRRDFPIMTLIGSEVKNISERLIKIVLMCILVQKRLISKRAIKLKCGKEMH